MIPSRVSEATRTRAAGRWNWVWVVRPFGLAVRAHGSHRDTISEGRRVRMGKTRQLWAAAFVRTESRVFLYSAVEIIKSPVASFFLAAAVVVVVGAMVGWGAAWCWRWVVEELVCGAVQCGAVLGGRWEREGSGARRGEAGGGRRERLGRAGGGRPP